MNKLSYNLNDSIFKSSKIITFKIITNNKQYFFFVFFLLIKPGDNIKQKLILHYSNL